jgi:hypothetical protein
MARWRVDARTERSASATTQAAQRAILWLNVRAAWPLVSQLGLTKLAELSGLEVPAADQRIS